MQCKSQEKKKISNLLKVWGNPHLNSCFCFVICVYFTQLAQGQHVICVDALHM